MRSYSKFLLHNVFSKVGFYGVFIAAAIALPLVDYLQMHSANKYHAIYISNVTTFGKFFPFLFASLFTTYIIVLLFKDGEEDGSDLLVVSKPISRKTILFSKFVLLIGFIAMYSIFDFVVHSLSSLFDQYHTPILTARYAGSLAVGGLIIQLIISIIILFLAAFLGKVSVIITGLMMGAFIPVFSFILTPALKGTIQQNKFSYDARVMSKSTIEKYKEKIGLDIVNGKPTITVDPSLVQSLFTECDAFVLPYNLITHGTDGEHYSMNPKVINYYNSYLSSIKYEKAAYGDLWYQWGRFMDIFHPRNSIPAGTAKRYDMTTTIFTNDPKHKGQEGYYYAPDDNWYEVEYKNRTEKFLPVIANAQLRYAERIFSNTALTFDALFKSNRTKSDFDSVIKQMALINNNIHPIDSTHLDKTYEAFEKIFTSNVLAEKLQNMNRVLVKIYPTSGSTFSTWANFFMYQYLYSDIKNTPSGSSLNLTLPEKTENLQNGVPAAQQWIVRNNDARINFHYIDFIETDKIILVWMSIGLILLALTVVIYSRRDFK